MHPFCAHSSITLEHTGLQPELRSCHLCSKTKISLPTVRGCHGFRHRDMPHVKVEPVLFCWPHRQPAWHGPEQQEVWQPTFFSSIELPKEGPEFTLAPEHMEYNSESNMQDLKRVYLSQKEMIASAPGRSLSWQKFQTPSVPRSYCLKWLTDLHATIITTPAALV